MVRQGDILKVNLNPIKGHEQAGYRPVLIISSNEYIRYTNLVIACPISNTANKFPLHIPLDDRTKTTGSILCQHIKTLDINARGYEYIEKIPDDILQYVLDIIKIEFKEN